MKIERIPHVSIIIINWNGWKDTIECLESIYQIDYANYDVILVDNNSSDDSIKYIKDYCLGKIVIKSKYIEYNYKNKPIKIEEFTNDILEKNFQVRLKESFLQLSSNKKIHLILNNKNYFFVKGNNIAINYAINNLKTNYILLLNNDTSVEVGFLSELITIMEKDKEIGIIGPRVCLYNDPERNQFEYLQNIKNYPIEEDFISGSAFLLKKELIETIGLLDTRFIHYIEDKDYCYTARKAGYKVLYYPTKNRVLHKGAVSMNKVKGLQLYFKTRNTFLLKRKYNNNLQFLSFFLKFFIITLILELKRFPKEKKNFLKGIKDGIFLILKDKSLLLKKC